MKRAVLVALLAVPALALAQKKAPEPKMVPVPEAECDLHKALMGAVQAAIGAKGRVEMVDLENGHAMLLWVGKSSGVAALEAAAAQLGEVQKAAMEGKAKLSENHLAILTAAKGGKILMGMAKLPMGLLMTALSADPAMAKLLHAETARMKELVAAMSNAPTSPATPPAAAPEAPATPAAAAPAAAPAPASPAAAK